MFDEVDDRENQVQATDEESYVRTTEWYNPTDDDVVLELHVDTPGLTTRKVRFRSGEVPKPLTYRERTGNIKAVVRAKSSTILSSDYDNAIQKVVNGVIVSGLAPQLKKQGCKVTPKLAPALDTQRQQQILVDRAAQVAIEQKAIAEIQLRETQAELARVKAALEAHNSTTTQNQKLKKD